MTHNKTPKERLDTLLAGLEDEVLRSDLAGLHSEDEDTARDAARVMRSSIESLIRAPAGSLDRRQQSLLDEGGRAKGLGAKVAQLMERAGHWAGVTQSGRAPGLSAPVRMAFSGEQPEEIEKTERKTKRRRSGETVDTEDKDSSDGGK